MAISPVKITNGLNKAIESRWMTKKLQEGLKDPAGFAAKMMVLSFVTKDAVNCAIYTYQSANNKKIPEDKRAFVASLDLIQGFINVGGQLLAASLVDKLLTPKLFGKYYSGENVGSTDKSRLLPDNLRGLVKDVMENNTTGKNKKIVTKVQNIIKSKSLDISKISAEEAEKVILKLVDDMAKGSKNFKSLQKGLGLLVTALATTALVKRTLNPLIATPLAGMLSDKWQKEHKSAEDKTLNEAVALQSMYKSKVDKTAFSNVASK